MSLLDIYFRVTSALIPNSVPKYFPFYSNKRTCQLSKMYNTVNLSEQKVISSTSLYMLNKRLINKKSFPNEKLLLRISKNSFTVSEVLKRQEHEKLSKFSSSPKRNL